MGTAQTPLAAKKTGTTLPGATFRKARSTRTTIIHIKFSYTQPAVGACRADKQRPFATHTVERRDAVCQGFFLDSPAFFPVEALARHPLSASEPYATSPPGRDDHGFSLLTVLASPSLSGLVGAVNGGRAAARPIIPFLPIVIKSRSCRRAIAAA